jgi:hypothetical protein
MGKHAIIKHCLLDSLSLSGNKEGFSSGAVIKHQIAKGVLFLFGRAVDDGQIFLLQRSLRDGAGQGRGGGRGTGIDHKPLGFPIQTVDREDLSAALGREQREHTFTAGRGGLGKNARFFDANNDGFVLVNHINHKMTYHIMCLAEKLSPLCHIMLAITTDLG